MLNIFFLFTSSVFYKSNGQREIARLKVEAAVYSYSLEGVISSQKKVNKQIFRSYNSPLLK